jgi:glycosyltransferase involved in cell wall biosynthesis
LKQKFMFVVNTDKFFLSHRLPIALALLQKGFEVHIATGLTDFMDEMQAHGLVVHPLNLNRRSADVWSNGHTFFQLMRLFIRVRPDVVHLVTIKPVLLGGLAIRFSGVRCVVAAISGLGFVFLSKGVIASLRRTLVGAMYRLALRHENLKVIFQNEDDREKIIGLTGLPRSKTILIRGSGVDLNEYMASPLPNGIPVVMMATRLLVDKGVHEFIEAAALLKDRGTIARFVLVGNPDPGNPATISDGELNHWLSEGLIEYWGRREDMPYVLSLSHIVVLPSYMEGLPKILIEAAACGRPVVTTNVPGCRDAIIANTTGVLIPLRDPLAIADTVDMLLANRSLCEQMGRAGRVMAENSFDVNAVIKQHLLIYDELLVEAP